MGCVDMPHLKFRASEVGFEAILLPSLELRAIYLSSTVYPPSSEAESEGFVGGGVDCQTPSVDPG